jgi:hypothetical protein
LPPSPETRSQRAGGGGVPGFGGAAVPARRLSIVRGQPSVLDVEVADQCRGVGIASQCRAAQPRFTEHEILLDIAPFHQREPPVQLRRALPALGSVVVELRRDRRITRHADPLLGQDREQIERGRQFGLCGTPQMLGDFVPPGLVRRPGRQGQRVAETAFRATGGGRALVPAVRPLEVAHLVRAAGQQIGEHRLCLGRAGLGGLPRPFEGSGEIRFARLLFGKQTFGSVVVDTTGETVHAQPAEQGLRLDMPVAGGTLKPTGAFDSARRHPGAFEIAAGDAILRLGNASLGGARQQWEGLGNLALLAEPDRPAQCRLGRGETNQPVEDEHPASDVTARACPPARTASCGRAGS